MGRRAIREGRDLEASVKRFQSALEARDLDIQDSTKELKRVNETLWQIEDDIRAKEAAKAFDADFIALARAIYRNNDERGRLKQEINALLKSDVTEEKQYSQY